MTPSKKRPRESSQSLQKKEAGIIVVITGDGKGKTTSALGMALRAVGHGMKVCMVSFIKGSMYSGEIGGIKKLAGDVELYIGGKGFYNPKMHAKHRAGAQLSINLAREKMLSGKFDILILDEINNALKLKLIDLAQVLDLMENKPAKMHLILTGRDAHKEVIKKAHTVTEMKEIKHAYRKGIKPQKGIDY